MALNHVMIDLETGGTRPGCVVLTIGAVLFDPEAGLLSQDTFYRRISLKDSLRRGFRLEAGTIEWWMRQSDEARKEAWLSEDRYPPDVAASQFAAWFRGKGAHYIWAHGPSFDCSNWGAVYSASGIEAPWDFRQERDTRTVYELSDEYPNRMIGVHHHALDDAISQATAVCKAYSKIGGWQNLAIAHGFGGDRVDGLPKIDKPWPKGAYGGEAERPPLAAPTAGQHELYKDGDDDAPGCVKDGNGAIVLGMCRKCGKAESQLDMPCVEGENKQ